MRLMNEKKNQTMGVMRGKCEKIDFGMLKAGVQATDPGPGAKTGGVGRVWFGNTGAWGLMAAGSLAVAIVSLGA